MEMLDTAQILNAATNKSLVIVDERNARSGRPFSHFLSTHKSVAAHRRKRASPLRTRCSKHWCVYKSSRQRRRDVFNSCRSTMSIVEHCLRRTFANWHNCKQASVHVTVLFKHFSVSMLLIVEFAPTPPQRAWRCAASTPSTLAVSWPTCTTFAMASHRAPTVSIALCWPACRRRSSNEQLH